MGKNTLTLMGDFETNKTILSEKTKKDGTIKRTYKASVWLSCFVDVFTNELYSMEYNINDTMSFLFNNSKKNDIVVYFHNLKFDGKFIIDFLLKSGWQFNEKLNEKMNFSTLITDSGIFYEIIIKRGKGKNAPRITIRDSLKIIPLPVGAIAKSYNLPISKGVIDYEKYDGLEPSEIENLITDDEKEYCINDVKIVAYALKEQFEHGYTKMTSSSNAMFDFKTRFGKHKFKAMFPVLDMEHSETETVDDFIRSSYKGGYTYVNPKFKNKVINKKGQTYDVNSLYPSVMYNELLPVGMPLHYKGRYQYCENYPLYIQRVKCHFKLKPNKLPTIQVKGGRFIETEYLTDSRANGNRNRVTLTLTNVDLEIFLLHYDVSFIEYIEGYMFQGEYNIFKDYIDYWGEVKKNSEGGLRQLAKLMLNSLYGKFCSSVNNVIKEPYLKDGVVKYEDFESKKRKSVYTAMGSFITSYARRVTQMAFQNNIDICCYCDTDSIHLIGNEPKGILIDSKELGYWKLEGEWKQAKFIRAKTYYEYIKEPNKEDYHLDVKCAGMPQKCKDTLNMDNIKTFKQGLKVFGKLVPVNCDGGVVLEENYFTIK